MILCVGLTPTVQRTLRFPRLAVGGVNRARETFVTASGKAVNVGRVLWTLGANVFLVQPLGGDSGRYVAHALRTEGVPSENIDAGERAGTRTCTTLLFDDGTATTELVEEARPLGEAALHAVNRAIDAHLLHCRAVACSGSLAPGVPTDFYARIVRQGRENGVRVLVDAQGPALKAALAERPFLVKPNREEAAATLGFALTGDPATDARAAVAALLEAGAEWAMVSMGKDGSLLGGGASPERWHVVPPAVDAVNPIGSGDSLAAGTLYALTELHQSVPDAAVYGTACAAANALSATSGVLSVADVNRLLPQVTRTQT